MKHERFDIFNGRKFEPYVSYDDPSNEELGIKPYPGWVRALIWAAMFVTGFYLVVLPITRAIMWAFSI